MMIGRFLQRMEGIFILKEGYEGLFKFYDIIIKESYRKG
jgi:hypothetical protein